MYFLVGQFLLLIFTVSALCYTIATAFFPDKRLDWMRKLSLNSQWSLWLGEMDNPYSILNSRKACLFLAPLLLALLIFEIWLFV